MIPSNRGNEGRPSHKELSGKLRECFSLVSKNMWLPADPGKLKANFDEIEELFGIETTLQEDQNGILLAILGEIRPEHYVGGRPPQQAYEATILGKELFAFQWASSCYGRQMYFKFCIKGADADRRVYVCSVHPSR